MSEILVRAEGLGKRFPKSHRSSDRLRSLGRLLLGGGDVDGQQVLHDINLEVKRGESVAIIGENGAGKSTLLKLITGVLTATEGTANVYGKVGALLELGAGFHPEYSGRDNIAMAGALYGLNRTQIAQCLPGIIDFADIGAYIDEPVKHYSSGMVVRLGFAIIAALKPDLLITDEVLAVGDESFQKKCVRWMEDYLAGGGTLLLVSHSMYHVQKLCSHALWLHHGKVAMYGDVFDVSQAYLAWHERRQAAVASDHGVRAGQEFEIVEFTVNGQDESPAPVLEIGNSLRLRVRAGSRDRRTPVVLFGIARADGTPVYGVSSEMDAVALEGGQSSVYCAEIEFEDIGLLPGSYMVKVHVLDSEGIRLFDTEERTLTVRGESREFGLVRLPHRWIRFVGEVNE